MIIAKIPPALVSLLLTCSAALASAEPSRGVVIQGAHLTDTIGGYSVVIPTGWALDRESSGGDVRLSEPGGHGSCRFIMMEPSPLSVRDQFMLFKRAQPTVYKKMRTVRQRWGTLGGERAGFLESRRTKLEGDTSHAWNVITVHRTVPYVIDCPSPVDEAEAVRKDVEKLFGSFRWDAGMEHEDR